MNEIPNDIFDQVTRLSQAGNEAQERGNLNDAIAHWKQGLALLPDPRFQWSATSWLLAAIGEAQRQSGQIDAACQTFLEADGTDDGKNPFVQFMLGACLYDLGKKQ